MTAAGLATLSLCSKHSPPKNKKELSYSRDSIANARAWLEGSFTAKGNPGARRWKDYWLLSVERAARVSGDIRFGEDRWLEAGVQSIASRLLTKSSEGWRLRAGTPPGIEKLCFAAQFLARATVPLVLGVLSSDTDMGPFVSEILEDIGGRLERRVGFARLSEEAPLEDWLLTPVVIIDGGNEIFRQPLSALQRQLQSYANAGGAIIVINAPRQGGVLGECLFETCSWRVHDRVPNARMLGTAARTLLFDLGYIRLKRPSNRAVSLVVDCWFIVTRGFPAARLSHYPRSLKSDVSVFCTDPQEPAIQDLLYAKGLSSPGSTSEILWIRGETADEVTPDDVANARYEIKSGKRLFVDSIGNGSFAMEMGRRLAEILGVPLGHHPDGMVLRVDGTVVAVISPRDGALCLMRSPVLTEHFGGLSIKGLTKIFEQLNGPVATNE
jgi:hypothetical protein